MYYDDDSGTLNFVLGMALGALIGAGVALLVAPEAGSRTRRRLRETAEDWGDTAGDRLQDAAGDVRKAADDARKAAVKSGERIAGAVGKKSKKRFGF